MTVTTKSFSDGPDANTSDAFEQVGRLFDTDGAERTRLQIGCSTFPVALTQPVLETISQASTPVVPPISEITPLGALTVTEQFGPELWVWVPPGHLWSVSTTKLVMWNVSRPDGQPELQMMLPLSSNPVTL